MSEDIRWKQRFQNYDRAFVLLCEALERGPDVLSLLEKQGVIQRFELAFELAWKTLKDYLEANGVVISPVTPRQVIKEAFAAKVIADGQVWIDKLDTEICFHIHTIALYLNRRLRPLPSVICPSWRISTNSLPQKMSNENTRPPTGRIETDAKRFPASFRNQSGETFWIASERNPFRQLRHRPCALGEVDALRAESIAAELDELPLPYRYDVKPFHLIKLVPLREHIERVGITVYPEEKSELV